MVFYSGVRIWCQPPPPAVKPNLEVLLRFRSEWTCQSETRIEKGVSSHRSGRKQSALSLKQSEASAMDQSSQTARGAAGSGGAPLLMQTPSWAWSARLRLRSPGYPSPRGQSGLNPVTRVPFRDNMASKAWTNEKTAEIQILVQGSANSRHQGCKGESPERTVSPTTLLSMSFFISYWQEPSAAGLTNTIRGEVTCSHNSGGGWDDVTEAEKMVSMLDGSAYSSWILRDGQGSHKFDWARNSLIHQSSSYFQPTQFKPTNAYEVFTRG